MHHISCKTFTFFSLALLFLILGLLSLSVIVIDPFQIYRLASFYTPPIDNTTQVYANAGIVRHYEYDSAIVGSSVTENFHPSYMDKCLSGRFIKLCTSAATARNHALLLDLAFKTHKIKRIVYGLDVYSFISLADETGSPVPFYLYDDNPFNDVAYWLNRSVLGSFLPRCIRSFGTQQTDAIRDTMYNWAGRDRYGKIALYSASFTPPESELAEDTYLFRALVNLDTHLLPFITDHPETEFDIFFPPYSAAEWARMKSRGTLNAMLSVRNLCYQMLTSLDNVHIFDFETREDWVLNLNNYKDALHYGEWINDAITECIANKTGLVTSESEFLQSTNQLRKWAELQIQEGGWCFPDPE